MEGYCEVLQQKPRSVTAEPPSLVMLALHVADVAVMLDAVDKVIVIAPLEAVN
jgi:hypothetical protein